MPSSKFVIIRQDLMHDPVTIITQGLLIGRLPQCELLLNHPAVSRVQAGIRELDSTFYLFNLRQSNPVKLNGKPVEQNSALAAGDILEVGPFLLEVDSTADALVLMVTLQIGIVVEATDHLSPHIDTSKLVPPDLAGGSKKVAVKARPAPLPGDKALDIFWDKRIREAGKMMRPSVLFPKGLKRVGKAQFNWTPTSDLVARWPVSFFIWGALGVGLVSIAAAYWFTSAYAPAPVSYAHAKTRLDPAPPIAVRANANACTNCHSFAGNMELNCAACHTTEAFIPTVTSAHAAAGVGCVSCHAEHQGSGFQPAATALLTCANCHQDANRNSYNGRRVSTPHGGTFGYPVVDGKWKWTGLSDADLSLKQIAIKRLPGETDDQWRSKQFHTLHLYRVRALPGMKGNEEDELSCSSCHTRRGDPETPRTTCGACHNGSLQPGTNRVVISKDKPNCYSCHLEHVRDKRRWNGTLPVRPATNQGSAETPEIFRSIRHPSSSISQFSFRGP